MDDLTIFNEDLPIKQLGMIIYSLIGVGFLVFSIIIFVNGYTTRGLRFLSILFVIIVAPLVVAYPYYGDAYLILQLKESRFIAKRPFYVCKKEINISYDKIVNVKVEKKFFTIVLSDDKQIQFQFSRKNYKKEVEALNFLKKRVVT